MKIIRYGGIDVVTRLPIKETVKILKNSRNVDHLLNNHEDISFIRLRSLYCKRNTSKKITYSNSNTAYEELFRDAGVGDFVREHSGRIRAERSEDVSIERE